MRYVKHNATSCEKRNRGCSSKREENNTKPSFSLIAEFDHNPIGAARRRQTRKKNRPKALNTDKRKFTVRLYDE